MQHVDQSRGSLKHSPGVSLRLALAAVLCGTVVAAESAGQVIVRPGIIRSVETEDEMEEMGGMAPEMVGGVIGGVVGGEMPPELMGVAGMPGAAVALSPSEIEELRAQYESLPFEERQTMKAYYADLGVRLDDVLGITARQAQEAQRTQGVLMAMREMDFTRRPQAVLAALSKIAYGGVPQPNGDMASGREVALWIQLHAMAGAWDVIGGFLKTRPESEGSAIYGLMLQNLSRNDPGLLPEEVLLVADASPATPTEAQLASLSRLLQMSSQKHSTHVLMQRIGEGTRIFGKADPAQQRRTVEFLSAAGLVVEAYDFLPSLEEARAAADADLILVHARYKENLARKQVPGPVQDGYREEAWDLYCEVSRLPRTSLKTMKEALTRNLGMMSLLPRVKVTPWLEEMFASPTVGPMALEVLTLKADTIGDQQLGDEKRAETIVLMKECVDVLLAHNDPGRSAEIDSLRAPLRMLTGTLASELEGGADKRRQQQNQGYWGYMPPTYDSQVILRAIPDSRWLDAIEPSLASRVTKAGISVALNASDLELAMNLLRDGLRRAPSEASNLADHFLVSWASVLGPRQEANEFPMWMWYNSRTTAPVTRGKQTRRLQRLHELFAAFESSGLDPRTLPSIVQAFQACHASTEIYTREDIERVFGPIAEIPSSTCVILARTMGQNLSGDWRNREAQQKKGVKRSDGELARLVDKGYALAIDLMESAMASGEDSWRISAIKAGLTFDRMQYRNIRKQLKPEEQNAYRQAAFMAFEHAAMRYAEAVTSGQEREDVDVYTQWFGAALGAPQLNFVAVEDMTGESAQQDDQIDHIRRAMGALPPDAAFRHVSTFAQTITAAVGGADPEVKPKLVKHALRVIGDHPAGASLRAQEELYRDLMNEEIKLRLTIDGEDRVGVKEPFGVLISLRYTNAVERETGGFGKYLQNGVYAQVGTTWREIDYRDRFQKQIEEALSKSFTIETLSFFDAFVPPNTVKENGEEGWLEKPMAYVILSRNDVTVDTLPQIVLDMQFSDDTGPVTLAIPSNTAVLALGEESSARPVDELAVVQVVDLRDAVHGDKEKTLKLEVTVKGKGVSPDVREILAGLETAAPGYEVKAEGIESQPAVVLQSGTQQSSRFFFGSAGAGTPPEEGYPTPDERGMYRLPTEKSWTVVYTPVGDRGGTIGGIEFRLPTLKSGVQAKLESRQYADFDIVPVSGPVVRVDVPWGWQVWALVAPGLLAAFGVIVAVTRMLNRRAPEVAAGELAMPVKLTPLSTILALQRWHSEHQRRLDPAVSDQLLVEIKNVERRYFGPEAAEENGDLSEILKRWSARVMGG